MEAQDRRQLISAKSLFQLQHYFNLIGRRIVPCYFFTHNPKEVMRWQFNACRQTAIICAYFLDQLAENLNNRQRRGEIGVPLKQFYPFVVNTWDSHFEDCYNTPYNHAWAFLDSQDNPGPQGLFVDVARISYPTAVIWGFNTPEHIFNDMIIHPTNDYIEFKETGPRECMPWKDMLDQKELYTGKVGWEICKEIEQALNVYSIDFKTFDPSQ